MANENVFQVRQRKNQITITPGFTARPATTSLASGGWSKTADISLSLSPNQYGVMATTRVTNIAGGTTDAYGTLRSVVAMDALGVNGKFEIPVYIPLNIGNGAQIDIYLSSDVPGSNPPTVTATNNIKFSFPQSQFKKGQWQILSIHPNATTSTTSNPIDPINWVTTGTVDTSNIKQIQVYTYIPGSGTDKYVDIGNISFGGTSTPYLMIGFDGAGQDLTHINTVLPTLRKYGMSACFSIQGQNIPVAGNTIITLVAAGMEVSNEGLNHTNYNTSPATLLSDVATASANYDALSLGVGMYQQIFTAPQNSLSPSQITSLQTAGFNFIRAGNRTYTPTSSLGVEPIAPIGQFPTSAMTSTQLIAALDAMELHGESCLVLFHSIPNIASGTATGTDVAASDFIAFIAEAALRVGQGRIRQGSCQGFVNERNSALLANSIVI
jgi:hypothetical protein